MMQKIRGKRATVAFVVSSSLSWLGNSAASVVLPLVLLATTGDALAAGALAIACAVPQVVAGVLGGAVLDRFNRRDVSIAADIVSALAIAALPIVDMTVGLSFGWFVLFGIVGAVGDVPGMTARDTLLPTVVKHDGLDLQRFMGVTQSTDSIIAIIGPAVAALSMGVLGPTNALWFTAAMSACAVVATLAIPRGVGAPPIDEPVESLSHLVKTAVASTRTGAAALFKNDVIVRFSMVFSLAVVMVLGGWQGLVMPMHFTEIGHPELLGYVVSAMSLGALGGSLLYTALAPKLKRRTWYAGSIVGTVVGIAVMGALPAYPALLAGAAFLGFSSGPLSALLNYYVFDRIPNEELGAAMGTLNSLMLVVGPAAVFITSIAVSALGVGVAAAAVAVAWALLSACALVARPMRNI